MAWQYVHTAAKRLKMTKSIILSTEFLFKFFFKLEIIEFKNIKAIYFAEDYFLPIKKKKKKKI